ncbi:hypothetical protein QJS10_CPB04g01248 [Acorus calamus]|uniref:DUF4283 domain-containing protein n=1 Tax=Acorus calamus TaxID=4465 RepID=A0AAV9F0Q5_ACOCL|nr:hypothetical protein QJS10_CPB04g01248 [Acorus calamus]
MQIPYPLRVISKGKAAAAAPTAEKGHASRPRSFKQALTNAPVSLTDSKWSTPAAPTTRLGTLPSFEPLVEHETKIAQFEQIDYSAWECEWNRALIGYIICVEIEASTIFPDDVTVEIPGGGRDQFKVIYEWRPEPCLHCHTFGHYSENCCKKTSSSKPSLTSKQPAIIPLANASNDPPSSTSPSTSTPSPTLNQSASAPTQNGSSTLALVDADSTIKVSNVSKSSVGPSNHSCGSNASSSVRGVGDAAVIAFSGAQVAVGGPSLDTTMASISVKISGDDSGAVPGMSKPIVTMVDYGSTVMSLTGEDVSLWAEGAASVIHNSSNDEDSFYLLDPSKDMGVKTMDCQWVIGGDFNEVRFSFEKSSGRPIQPDCLGLSDHSPLKVIVQPLIPPGPKPFKYFQMWEVHPDFSEVVMQAWRKRFSGTPMFVLTKKLQYTKAVLKEWNRSVFGPLQHKFRSSRMVLEQAQAVLLSDPLNAHSIQLEAQAKVYYLLHLRTEECFLRQKSRQLWLSERDCNSKFFYSMMQARVDRNSIRQVQFADGTFSLDPVL